MEAALDAFATTFGDRIPGPRIRKLRSAATPVGDRPPGCAEGATLVLLEGLRHDQKGPPAQAGCASLVGTGLDGTGETMESLVAGAGGTDLLPYTFPLLGVALGAYLGARLQARRETEHWLREKRWILYEEIVDWIGSRLDLSNDVDTLWRTMEGARQYERRLLLLGAHDCRKRLSLLQDAVDQQLQLEFSRQSDQLKGLVLVGEAAFTHEAEVRARRVASGRAADAVVEALIDDLQKPRRGGVPWRSGSS